MSETTANLWILDTPALRRRRAVGPLAAGLLTGILAGSLLTALASGPIRTVLAVPTPSVAAREWPKPALDRQWRGWETPVDAKRMFRSPR